MRLAPNAEQRQFTAALAGVLEDSSPATVARAFARGEHGPGRLLWRRLAELGLCGLAIPVAHGGSGATPVELVLAFEQLGRACTPGPYVESVVVLPALLAGTPVAHRLEDLAAGRQVGTVALAPTCPRALDADFADTVYVCAEGTLSTAAAAATYASVDPTRRLSDITIGPALAEVSTARRAANLGALATAAQLIGLGSALLDQASAYAKVRRQFGQPIGSFQAVKHQLADAAVALELARPLVWGAALAVGTPDEDRDISAAKVAGSDAADRAARTALQVHGAIGYTAELDLSLWLTKTRALISAWGTRAEHRRRVADALRAARAERRTPWEY